MITRRAFSPQLTERTGPEASGPRNDDTFHEGPLAKKGSTRTPRWREFVYTSANWSIEWFCRLRGNVAEYARYFICLPASLSLYLLYASLPRCLDAPSIISSRFTYVFATDNSVWTNLVSFDVRCRVDTSLSFFWRVRITLQLLLLFICWKEIEFVRRTKPILLIARRSRRLRVSFLNIQNRGILFHEEQFNLWKVTLSRLIVSDTSYRSSFSRK